MTQPPSHTPLKIVFAGTPEFAAKHLQALLGNRDHRVIAVYTQPDRPAGRGKRLTASPVKQLALQHNLPVYQPVTLKSADAQAAFAELTADLMVVVAYGLILPKPVLDSPRLGCINVHASLLPRWRGAAPIQRAIEAGDAETGITIMQMDEGLDTGAMLLTRHCPISAEETAESLESKLALLGPDALLMVLDQASRGELNPTNQDDAKSTYAAKLSKQEAGIDWFDHAFVLERRIRAFNPFPVCYTGLDNLRIKIWKARLPETQSESTHTDPPGTIISLGSEGIGVSCGEGQLLIEELQLPGKKRLKVQDILNANQSLFTIGKCFQNRGDD